MIYFYIASDISKKVQNKMQKAVTVTAAAFFLGCSTVYCLISILSEWDNF